MKIHSKKAYFFILISYAVGMVILGLTLFVGIYYNIPFEKITGDPANYYQSHPFTGIVSNIGALLWCITATTCLYTGFLLINQSDIKTANYLLFSGFFSFILLMDDFFMFHDYLFYSFDQFTLEPTIYAIYLFLILYFVYAYHKIILKGHYYLLGAAILFLGLSAIFDLIFPSEGLEYFFEDGLKFMGIISWMLFFVTSSYKILSQKTSPCIRE